MALARRDGSIHLSGDYLDSSDHIGVSIIKLEGHTDAVTGVSFSFDGGCSHPSHSMERSACGARTRGRK